MPCINVNDSVKLNENFDRIEDMARVWDNSKFTKDSFGRGQTEGALKKNSLNHKMFVRLILEKTGKVFDPTVEFNANDMRRVEKEIKRLDKKYEKGNLGWLQRNFFIHEATLDQTPQTTRYRKRVDAIMNRERTVTYDYQDKMSKSLNSLREEGVNRGLKKGLLKRELDLFKNLEELESQYIQAASNDDIAKKQEINREITELLESEGGGLVRDFNILMETPTADLKIGMDIIDKNGTSHGKATNEMIRAVKQSREVLDEMGNVMVRGLEASEKVIMMKYAPGLTKKQLDAKKRTPMENKARNAIDQLHTGIKQIKAKMEKGDYMPHYALEGLEISRNSIDNLMTAQTDAERVDAFNSYHAAIGQLINVNQPSSTKPRSQSFKDIYEKNSIGIIKKYANDAISFNSLSHMQLNYMETMKHLPETDSRFIQTMKEHLSEHFITTTQGHTDRGKFTNQMVRYLTAAEFISKLGFGVRSATKNALSGVWFVQNYGMKGTREAMRQFNSNNSVGFSERPLNEIMQQVEKESGFMFPEGELDPLFTEGLLPAEGIKKSKIKYDEERGELVYRDSKGIRSVESMIDMTANKAAIFQRITENALRKRMFRVAFYHGFKQIASNKHLYDKMGESGAINKSKEIALDMVHAFAGNYNISSKAPVLGGTHKKWGAYGQVIGQFLHYPMFFARTQYKLFKQAGDDLMAGHYKTKETAVAARFAGITLLTSAIGAVFNTEISTLMENDTYERLKKLTEFMLADEDERENLHYGNGLTSLFTGPIVSDAIFALQATGIAKMPDNEISQLFLGYEDFAEKNGQDAAKEWAFRMNVQFGKVVNKHIPTMMRGGDMSEILRNELSLYPSKKTRSRNKSLRKAVGLVKDEQASPMSKLQALQQSSAFQQYQERLSGAKTP